MRNATEPKNCFKSCSSTEFEPHICTGICERKNEWLRCIYICFWVMLLDFFVASIIAHSHWAAKNRIWDLGSSYMCVYIYRWTLLSKQNGRFPQEQCTVINTYCTSTQCYICSGTVILNPHIILVSFRYLERTPHHWHPNHSILVKEIENVSSIKMAICFNHTMNFQDYGEKNRRRSELVLEVKRIFEELHIIYTLLPQEVVLIKPESTTMSSTRWLHFLQKLNQLHFPSMLSFIFFFSWMKST